MVKNLVWRIRSNGLRKKGKSLCLLVAVILICSGIFIEPVRGATLFRDDFNSLSLDVNEDGGENWVGRWVRWNVNALDGNSDDYFKMWDTLSYNGGPTVQSALQSAGWGSGPFLHETSGGTLKMRAYPAPSNLQSSIYNYPYVASMISTEKSFSMNEGYFEIRYRNKTIDKGTHVSCWLLDVNGDWPPEIDIFETLSEDVNGSQNFFAYNAHGAPSSPTYTAGTLSGDQNFEYLSPTEFTSWQTIRFEWDSNELIWKRNGVIVRKQANYLADRQMYFLVTMEGANVWTGDPDGSTRWPQEAEIDYVEIGQGTATSSELLANPGFEEGTASWTDWGGNLTTVTSPVNSGSRAAYLTGRTNTWQGPVQDITSALQANGQGDYDIAASSRLQSGTDNVKVTLQINDSSGTHYVSTPYTTNVSTTYKSISSNAENIVWSGNLSSAYLFVETQNTTANMYVDDVSLKKSDGTPPPPPPSNIVQNAEFESGTANWTNLATFSVTSGGVSGNAGKLASGSWGGVQQDVTLEAGKTYTLKAYGKMSGTGSAGYVAIQYSAGGVVNRTNYKLEFTTTSYVQKSTTFTLPSNLEWAQVFISNEHGTKDFYFDNIELYE